MNREYCPICDSADNVAVYDQGDYESWFCYSPGCTNRKADGQSKHKYPFYEDYLKGYDNASKGKVKVTKEYTAQELNGFHEMYEGCSLFSEKENVRGIPGPLLNQYGYRRSPSNPNKIVLKVTSHKGEFLGYKWRMINKVPGQSFGWVGGVDTKQLIGQGSAAYPDNLVITEGELDALSVLQMHQKGFSCVSLPNGAESIGAIDNCQQFLSRFKNVFLCFDSDKPGSEAQSKVLQKYPKYKSILIPSGMKDANDCLVKGHAKEFGNSLFSAKNQEPDYIEKWSDILAELDQDYDTVGADFGLEPMNELLGGMRERELTTIIGKGGAGKSTLVRQLVYEQARQHKNVIVCSTEESPATWMRKLAKMHTRSFDKKAFRETALFLKEFVTFIKPERLETTTEEGLFNLVRVLGNEALGRDASLVVFDNITTVAKGISGDYYKSINQLATRFISQLLVCKAHYIVVGHEKKQVDDKSPRMSDGDGLGGLNQMAQNVLSYKRTKEGLALLYVLKRRETPYDNMPSPENTDGFVNLTYSFNINGYEGGSNMRSVKVLEGSDAPLVDFPSPDIIDADVIEDKKENGLLEEEHRVPIGSTEDVRLGGGVDGTQELPSVAAGALTESGQRRYTKFRHVLTDEQRLQKKKEFWRNAPPGVKADWKRCREEKREGLAIGKRICAGTHPKVWGRPDVSNLGTTLNPAGEPMPFLTDWQFGLNDPETYFIGQKCNDQGQIIRDCHLEALAVSRKFHQEVDKG